MPSVDRILDANFNRAREALRTLEDASRFAAADRDLVTGFKSLRHDLQAILDRLPAGRLPAHRAVARDVGADVKTEAELRRASHADLVAAAGHRLTEALRSIEEHLKLLAPDRGGALARDVERLRYRSYDLAARILARLGTGRARQWRVAVLLTRSLCRHPWDAVLRASLDGGADCVQIREKALDTRPLLDLVRRAIDLARPAGAAVIVNDRVDVALAAEADGVHVGRDDLSVPDLRRLAGRTLLVGASARDLDEAERAVRDGADYLGIGAMFRTSLKPDRSPVGPALLRAVLDRVPNVPHLAIGGITPGNASTLAHAGARGVAVSRAVCEAEDPAAVVAALREAVERAASPGAGAGEVTQS